MAARSIKASVIVGFIGLGLALTPVAHADTPTSPSAPIIRSADRGAVMSGVGEERIADMGAVQGGGVSAGAQIPISDGNAAKLPVVKGEHGVICSTGQPRLSGVIVCG